MTSTKFIPYTHDSNKTASNTSNLRFIDAQCTEPCQCLTYLSEKAIHVCDWTNLGFITHNSQVLVGSDLTFYSHESIIFLDRSLRKMLKGASNPEWCPHLLHQQGRMWWHDRMSFGWASHKFLPCVWLEPLFSQEAQGASASATAQPLLLPAAELSRNANGGEGQTAAVVIPWALARPCPDQLMSSEFTESSSTVHWPGSRLRAHWVFTTARVGRPQFPCPIPGSATVHQKFLNKKREIYVFYQQNQCFYIPQKCPVHKKQTGN